VRHTTRRTGRPFRLVLEKTEAVFTRDTAQRRRWQEELAWLTKAAKSCCEPRRIEKMRDLGQPLSRYDFVQRLVAENAPEVFAMQSVALAAMIGLDQGNLATRGFEQVAGKNICAAALVDLAR
jgi:hypothetical protein